MINQKMILTKTPGSKAKDLRGYFELKEEKIDINTLGEGEVWVKVLYASVDPVNRVWLAAKTYIDQVKPGDVMKAFGLGQIVNSNNKKFKIGSIVGGILEWQQYLKINPAKTRLTIIPFNDYPNLSYFTSVLGINGFTAYFGLKEIGKPKPGETLVVSTAAGATGSIVCSLGKIWGCRVIGIAGADEKCEYVKKVLGADECINYKTTKDMRAALKKCCPKGIDVYFDNVGEETLDAVLTEINIGARIILCGATSTYLDFHGAKGLSWVAAVISKRATMQGLNFGIYKDKFPDALIELMGYIDEGKLRYNETIMNGLKEAPSALQLLFDGKNIGKIVVKVGDPMEASKL